MKDYLPESMRRCPPGYTRGELERAMEDGTILTARAVRCDEKHDLILDLGCAEGRIPRLEAAEGIACLLYTSCATATPTPSRC